ncbi:DEAD/DEAH box helicase [Vampirovibrio chlorellavorus]|uniref:DEAD/DEAH box helicase n=1 Tax=Vampirovibrio chlorellavorus TaxID=758823 RepID=UPI0026EB3558|nr:DEAD/DEAH box helicase [Vampirovibrio chlorellavorus]
MTQFQTLPLDAAVLKSLDQMGYQEMTPIQEMAIPKLLTGQDFLGQAPTGTGKTAAFGIPLISRLQAGSGNIDALILGPTRELVQQIAEELNRIGAEKGIQALPIFGGENVFVQKEALRERKAQIIVGTPGRVLDHIGQVTMDLSQTRMVILDEADEMLDMGFRPDIESIFKHLPGGRETWLFSATVSPEIRKIADQYMYHPEEVRIQPQTKTAENIQQLYYIVKDEEKHRLLRRIVKDHPDMYGIVFCQTKRDVVLLTRKMRDYYPIDCLHGAMAQGDRDQVMDAFRSGKLKLLVSTDIMARGIDVDNLTHVINFSPPHDPESYIHRIGRTARKGETGVAMTFFNPFEKRALEQLERRVKMGLQKHPSCELEFEDAPPKGYGRYQGAGNAGYSHGRGGQKPNGQHPNGQKRRPRRSGSGKPNPVAGPAGAAAAPTTAES